MTQVITLNNSSEIIALARLGVPIFLKPLFAGNSIQPGTLSIKSFNGTFFITLNGEQVDTLLDSAGDVDHKHITRLFYVMPSFEIRGYEMNTRNRINEVLAQLRIDECHAKATKGESIRAAKNLQQKIDLTRIHNANIRQLQDIYDNVSMAFWHLLDVIEREPVTLEDQN